MRFDVACIAIRLIVGKIAGMSTQHANDDALALTWEDDVASNVRAEAARRRWSGRRLAAELGVSPAWVSTRMSGARHWRLADIDLIATAWGMDPLQLLARREGWAPRGSNPQPTD